VIMMMIKYSKFRKFYSHKVGKKHREGKNISHRATEVTKKAKTSSNE